MGSVAFPSTLGREDAFYKVSDYEAVIQKELTQTSLLPVSYRWETESKIKRIAKQILSVIIFPIGLYKIFHAIIGFAIVPSSVMSYCSSLNRHLDRSKFSDYSKDFFKYKRITIEVDGSKIDAVILGKPFTLDNGRWLIATNGNGEFYEDKLVYETELKGILHYSNSNGIIFNYPGVGLSSGFPNKQAMVKAYCAILSFVEDKQNGLAAKEIISYGHSIGGGVQGEALNSHELKDDIKYVFVKSRTFSDLSTIASQIVFKGTGFLVKIFGWNMDSVKSSKKLQCPEIILQTADVKGSYGYSELKDSSLVIHDDIIPPDSSLAKALLQGKTQYKNKIFLGIRDRHNYGLGSYRVKFLSNKINEFFS